MAPHHVAPPNVLRRAGFWCTALACAGPPGSALLCFREDLGPVEARHEAVCLGDEEAGRVKPWLAFAQVKVVPVPCPLLRVLCEPPAVEAQPLVLVMSGDEGAQPAAGPELGPVQ